MALTTQWTFHIEVKCDFADPDRIEALLPIVLSGARSIITNAQLLADKGVEPIVNVWGDDFFGAHKDYKLWDDLIGKGTAELKEAGCDTTPTEVSEELIRALRGEG